jgi:hypothetical protein
MAALKPARGRGLVLGALLVALLGGVGVGVGLVRAPERTLAAYLVAFAYAASIAVGALVLQCIGYAASARWLSVPRRLLDGIALAVVPLALLFVPLAAGAPWLYLWADPHAVAALPEETRALLEHKRPYLNVDGFAVRGAIYFAVWILAAGLLAAWSRQRDRVRPGPGASPEAALGRERAFASAAVPLVGFALTFAAFDWLMSLEPTWGSTIFGVYYFAGGFLGGIALLSVCAWRAARRPGSELAGVLTPHHMHALGRLLLAFTVFWAYVAYFQVFLIQIADRPDEVAFYLHRLHGSWRGFVWVLALGHFALPFLLLLPRALKQRAGYVGGLGAWLLVVHYLDVYWLVVPSVSPRGVAPDLADLAALALVGGVCVAFTAWLAARRPLVAYGDPMLPEGVAYASPT